MKNESCSRTTASTDKMMSSMTEMMSSQAELIGGIFTIMAQSAGQLIRSVLQNATAQKTSSCCEIPEPCWMPAKIADIECSLCSCSRGTVRLNVTNSDFQPRSYNVVAAGKNANLVSFDVGTFTLGPKERRTVTATFDATFDDDGKCPDALEALIWVLGCRNRYLRWTIHHGHRDEPCCFEFEVNDGPDNVLHWYDHFYHPRQCYGPATAPKPKLES